MKPHECSRRKPGGVAGKFDSELDWIFDRAVNRLPSAQERTILRSLYDRNLKRFAAQPDSARDFLTIGEAPLEHAQNPEKLAALATVTRAVLNLHEIITRN